MPSLPVQRIADLLQPYYPHADELLLSKLSVYLDLLIKWNGRTNLTAVRSPEAIVTRHFGESLFAAQYLPAAQTLLDLGSGAGFPGLPLQLALPHLRVTLAESQNKKSAFLREVARQLELETTVWPARAEQLPPGTIFDVVTLRAVDRPDPALREARRLAAKPGVVALWRSGSEGHLLNYPIPGTINSFISLIPCT